MRREPPTDGRKMFRPYTCGAWFHWARTTIHGAAMEMVGRMDIIGTRRGEIFFARTSVVWGQIGEGATIWGAAMFDGWAMAYGWRTYGRNIFRPYNRGVGANWARTTIHGVAIVDTRAIAYGWRT